MIPIRFNLKSKPSMEPQLGWERLKKAKYIKQDRLKCSIYFAESQSTFSQILDCKSITEASQPVTRLIMAQGLGRPRGPASHVPSGFSFWRDIISFFSVSIKCQWCFQFLVTFCVNVFKIFCHYSQFLLIILSLFRVSGDISCQYFHIRMNRWILTHVTAQAAKSATSPRLSPLLVSLAQSTEHPGNSRGLMGWNKNIL